MSDWKPIATAPADTTLELSIYDQGEYHALVFPCRRDRSGWRDVRANRSGHFRPIDDVCAMSALPPIATELLRYRNG